jgi:hypothetical protein
LSAQKTKKGPASLPGLSALATCRPSTTCMEVAAHKGLGGDAQHFVVRIFAKRGVRYRRVAVIPTSAKTKRRPKAYLTIEMRVAGDLGFDDAWIAKCLAHAASKKHEQIVPTVTGKVYNHSKRMKEKRAVLDGVAAELRRIVGGETQQVEVRMAAFPVFSVGDTLTCRSTSNGLATSARFPASKPMAVRGCDTLETGLDRSGHYLFIFQSHRRRLSTAPEAPDSGLRGSRTLQRRKFCAVMVLQQNLAASSKFQIKTEIARLSLLLIVGWPAPQ